MIGRQLRFRGSRRTQPSWLGRFSPRVAALAETVGFVGVFLVTAAGVTWAAHAMLPGMFSGAGRAGGSIGGDNVPAITIGAVAPVLVAALIVTWLFATRWFRVPPLTAFEQTGLPVRLRALVSASTGFAFGSVLVGLVVGVMAIAGWVSWQPSSEPGSPASAAVWLGGVLLLAAAVEEVLLRGHPFQLLKSRFSSAAAVITTSLVFGLLHAANPGVTPSALVNISLAGVLLGVAVLRTGSLWFAIGVHTGWNWIMAVSGLVVSGLPADMPRSEAVVSGPVFWTGGSFGPEGGMTVTLVILLGIAVVARMGPGRAGERRHILRNSGRYE